MKLRKSGLNLNSDKCFFGIQKEKLLGCLVSARGIKANPDKIATIANMQPPTNRKQVQKLIRKLATLNKFIAKSPERGLPFFRVLQNSDLFA